MLRRTTTTALAAILTTGLTLLAATPAAAACSTNQICLYQDTGYSNGQYIVTATNYTYHDGDTFNNGYHLYDAVSSYKNLGGSCWLLWSDHFLSGYSWKIYAYESQSSMIGYNDVASSHEWTFC